MVLINAKAINLTFTKATKNFRTADFSWPPTSDRWTNHSALAAMAVPVLALLTIQTAAQVWSVAWLPTLFGSASLPPNRPIWTMLVLLAGLWFGYLVCPVLISRVVGLGPGLAVNLRSNLNQAVLAVVIGVGTQLGVLPVLYWVVGLFTDADDPGVQAQLLVDRVNNVADVALLAIIVVLLAPIIEEWFYRGFFLTVLVSPLGRLGGALACSIVFALVHGSLILVPGLVAFSLALCALTMVTGRLGPAIISHMAFNATTLILLLRDGW